MFNKLFTKTNGLLILILLLAAFMRLYRIQDYITFLGDEGRDVLIVYNILHGHPTLLGPNASVGGFFLGPIYYYFMTPFLWLFNYNPVGPAVMVSLFGVATVWLVYFVGSKFFNKPTGLIAAFFYSISPVVIAYSRSSWNPNLMPFFILSLLYLLYRGITDRKWKYIFFSGILFGIAMQLHYLTTFVGVIVFVYIISSYLYNAITKRITLVKTVYFSLISYVLYTIGFVIGWSPFLAFELRHGFNNIRSIIDFIFHSKETGVGSGFQMTIGDVFFRVFGRLVTAFPDPAMVKANGNLGIVLWYWGTIILSLCAVGFLLYLFVKHMKDREKFLQYLLLVIWLGIGILLFGLYKKQIYDYYFAFLFPVPFLLVGGFLWMLYTKQIMLKGIGVAVFLAIAIVNLQGIPYRYEPNRQLNQMQTISQFVLSKANNKPFNFALITGGNSDQAYRYFFTVWGNPPVTIQNFQIDPQRKSVTDQLLVVCEQLPCHPEGASLWEVAGFGRAQIIGHWMVSVVEVYKLQHYYGK